MQPQFPIFIPSKGRASSRKTMRALDQMGLEYTVLVEEPELEEYARVIPSHRLLVLDPAYQASYEPCDGLGLEKPLGPGPARNQAWDLAAAAGHQWHWVMDDNIQCFYRLHQNRIHKVLDGAFFRIMEDWVLRYENVAMAGPNYEHFVPRRSPRPPLTFNTRIYSCNLIRTDLPFRWRGRYNEDTDLSLRLLKGGWCTVLFNALLQKKTATQRMPGGNTDAFYIPEGTGPKSAMLADLHPDVATVVWRWNRWHHQVDYAPFRHNRLRLRPDAQIPQGSQDYGLQLVQVGS